MPQAVTLIVPRVARKQDAWRSIPRHDQRNRAHRLRHVDRTVLEDSVYLTDLGDELAAVELGNRKHQVALLGHHSQDGQSLHHPHDSMRTDTKQREDAR